MKVIHIKTRNLTGYEGRNLLWTNIWCSDTFYEMTNFITFESTGRVSQNLIRASSETLVS